MQSRVVLDEGGLNLIVLFGSSLDQENLRTALWLEPRYPKALLAVRMFTVSHFARILSKNTGLHMIDSAAILKAPIEKWLLELKSRKRDAS